MFQQPFVTFAILFVSLSLSSQDLITPLEHSENWYDPVPVSGELRAGLVSSLTYEGQLPDRFSTLLPDQGFKYLLVEIASRDGRYTSHQSYPIEGKVGSQTFQWQSALAKKLKKYTPNEVTLLAWVVNDMNDEKSNFVPASWREWTDTDHYYVILLSKKKTYLNVYNTRTGDNESIVCKEYPSELAVSFNKYCEVPIGLIDKDSEVTIVQKGRRTQGKYEMHIAVQ